MSVVSVSGGENSRLFLLLASPHVGGATASSDEPTKGRGVDERFGRVVLSKDAELGGGVVEWVRVVPVVPALAKGERRDE